MRPTSTFIPTRRKILSLDREKGFHPRRSGLQDVASASWGRLRLQISLWCDPDRLSTRHSFGSSTFGGIVSHRHTRAKKEKGEPELTLIAGRDLLQFCAPLGTWRRKAEAASLTMALILVLDPNGAK